MFLAPDSRKKRKITFIILFSVGSKETNLIFEMCSVEGQPAISTRQPVSPARVTSARSTWLAGSWSCSPVRSASPTWPARLYEEETFTSSGCWLVARPWSTTVSDLACCFLPWNKKNIGEFACLFLGQIEHLMCSPVCRHVLSVWLFCFVPVRLIVVLFCLSDRFVCLTG